MRLRDASVYLFLKKKAKIRGTMLKARNGAETGLDFRSHANHANFRIDVSQNQCFHPQVETEMVNKTGPKNSRKFVEQETDEELLQ